MTTTAPHNAHDTTTERVLLVACALREKHWKLGVTPGHGHKPRERTVAARPQARVLQEVAQANSRCGLPASAPVGSGYAAGRAGCWRQRLLQSYGLPNQVGDSSSIAGNRRQRRAKSDAVAVRQLVRRLRRLHPGEGEGWRVVPVPPVAAADPRHLPRDWDTRKPARASPTTRSKGLLRSPGRRRTRLSQCPAPLDERRRWAGSPVPHGLRPRWRRGWAHPELLRQQMAGWEAERRALRESSSEASLEKGRQWRPLKGMGLHGAWLLVRAFLAWRACTNRRAVGG